MAITLTDSAVEQLRCILADAPPEHGLRLFVEKGGCAGWQYGMKVDASHPGDEAVARDGVCVYVDGESVPKLKGATLDYCDDLTGTGFRIENPNAARSCGCGTSFETEGATASDGVA